MVRKRLEKDGLSVDIIPTKQVFSPDEPLSFRVVYRNVGKQAFRLPDQPGLYNNWEMTLTWVRGPAHYMEHAAHGEVLAAERRPDAGQAHRALGAGQDTRGRGQVGSLHVFGGKGGSAKAITRHYAGKYKVNFDIHFPVKPQPDSNPVPLWPDDSIPTNPAEFEVQE